MHDKGLVISPLPTANFPGVPFSFLPILWWLGLLVSYFGSYFSKYALAYARRLSAFGYNLTMPMILFALICICKSLHSYILKQNQGTILGRESKSTHGLTHFWINSGKLSHQAWVKQVFNIEVQPKLCFSLVSSIIVFLWREWFKEFNSFLKCFSL